MDGSGGPWALVLAAGEGARLRSLTTDALGRATPKQFCALDGDESLLSLALDRAARVAVRERVTSIVAAEHECWWRRDLGLLPDANVIVQPANRGTAVGVLFPLLCILRRDPGARIVLLPSDHFVADELVLARSLRRALRVVSRSPGRIVLLGIVPDAPETGFGWIVPGEPQGHGALDVRSFVEKPPRPLAEQLMGQGAVWNSFILATTGETLLELFRRRMPHEVAALSSAVPSVSGALRPAARLRRVYERLEPRDFSRDLLEGFEGRLALVPVPACGWTDLGTPERVGECIARRTTRAQLPPGGDDGRLRLDLAYSRTLELELATS